MTYEWIPYARKSDATYKQHFRIVAVAHTMGHYLQLLI